MIELVMEWLATQLATALGCYVTKGFPSWGRSACTPPCVALELAGLGPRPSPRQGQAQPLTSTTARVTLLGKNEPDLWRITQLLATWIDGKPSATVSGASVFLTLAQPGQRHENSTEVEQERYGMEFTFGITW